MLFFSLKLLVDHSKFRVKNIQYIRLLNNLDSKAGNLHDKSTINIICDNMNRRHVGLCIGEVLFCAVKVQYAVLYTKEVN